MSIEPKMDRKLNVELSEHEIFMSFDNDDDAQLFHYWWSTKGLSAFQKWANKEIKNRSKDDI